MLFSFVDWNTSVACGDESQIILTDIIFGQSDGFLKVAIEYGISYAEARQLLLDEYRSPFSKLSMYGLCEQMLKEVKNAT